MVGAWLGWGIAGCGWVARDYVAPAIRESRNGRLLALLDRDPAALARMDAPGAVHATTALDAFLRTPGLQAVYVASPNDAHRPLVEAAARAGLAVLCEKPMAATLGDAEAMLRACEAAGTRYATAFDQRFHAAHRAIAGAVADGLLGTVTAIRIVYACWVDAGWAGDNWRVDPRRAGGGALMDLAPHGLDLAAMLLGEALTDVAALAQRRVHGYAVEDGALLMARGTGGALVQLHVAYNCPETLPRRRLEVVGTAGQIVAIDTMGQTPGGTVTFTDARDGSARPLDVPDAQRSPFTAQVEAFADAVLEDAAFAWSGVHDLRIMRLVTCAQAMADATTPAAITALPEPAR